MSVKPQKLDVKGTVIGRADLGQVEEPVTAFKINGADDVSVQRAYNNTFTASDEVDKAQAESNNALSNLGNLTNKTQIVDKGTWNTMNSTFKTPTAVTEADTYLSAQLEKIQSGKTSYSDQVKEMISKIQGREKFSYDVDNDPLFQQALASAMNSGNTAMQDTIGQASALTGGYGSSYATTAGNQQYNAFVEDAYNNLPEYYQMAFDAYQAEGDEMYRQLGMLSDADDREFNRTVTAYDATYQHRNQLYNEAYTQFRDSKTDAYNTANLKLNEHGQLVSDAYNYYNATSNYADTMYNREYTQWADEVNQAMQLVKMQNSDYWSQTNFDEGVRQYEKNFTENQRQFNQTMSYNYAKLKSDSSGSGSGKTSNGLKYPTETQNAKALEAYKTGGMDGLNKYLNSISPEYDRDLIADYVGQYGEIPLSERTYTMTDDTWNGIFSIGDLWDRVDSNDVVTDEYGYSYKMEDLKKQLVAGGMSEDEAEDFLGELSDKDEGESLKYSKKK